MAARNGVDRPVAPARRSRHHQERRRPARPIPTWRRACLRDCWYIGTRRWCSGCAGACCATTPTPRTPSRPPSSSSPARPVRSTRRARAVELALRRGLPDRPEAPHTGPAQASEGGDRAASAIPLSADSETTGVTWERCSTRNSRGCAKRSANVVLLCDVEGLSRKEAAARLGIPEGTLSGQLFRRPTAAGRTTPPAWAWPWPRKRSLAALGQAARAAPSAAVVAVVESATAFAAGLPLVNSVIVRPCPDPDLRSAEKPCTCRN